MTDPRILTTRNGDFRIAEAGPADAPVLLLSNSLGTPLEMWAPQAAAFAASHRVVRYDTRGHGGSPVTPGPYRFAQLGDDVLALMDALAIERALFCGISMGGHTALWLGIHAAARFNGLVVCNSAARIGTVEAWRERAALVRSEGAQAMQSLAATAPQRWFTEAYVQAHADKVARAQAWITATDPEGYAACCEALAMSDLRPDLGRITVPTLIVAGADDPVTTVADAVAMQTAIAGATLATVPASHLSNLEAEAAFNEALAGFSAAVRS